MQIIHVDDEWISTENFKITLQKVNAEYALESFNEPEDAIAYAQDHKIDVAFLDIEMYGMNGIELADELKKLQKNIQVVFVTAYNNYAMEAFKVKAQGYLLKPYDEAMLKAALDDAIANIKPEVPHIYFKTMPRFDLLVDGELVVFNGRKVKELLAYLVNGGGSIMETRQIMTDVWEDDELDSSSTSKLRTTMKRLNDALSKYGIENLIKTHGASRYIDATQYDSDYKRLMAGDEEIAKAFDGRYMEDYPWAQYTEAAITTMLEGQKEK